jgi:hypothetical protein
MARARADMAVTINVAMIKAATNKAVLSSTVNNREATNRVALNKEVINNKAVISKTAQVFHNHTTPSPLSPPSILLVDSLDLDNTSRALLHTTKDLKASLTAAMDPMVSVA